MTRVILPIFGGGIVNDKRDQSNGVARVVSNFDIYNSPRSLLPYRSSEDGNSNSANDLMQNWCIAKNTSSPTSSTDYSLFGLGRQTASNKVRIFKKNLTTGSATDLDDAGWTETANNIASTYSTPKYELFLYYPRTGYIYGAHGGRYIYAYDPDGGTAIDEDGGSSRGRDLTSFTTVAQGIVHSKDDIMYIPYDNKIAKNDNGTWTSTALTLPSEYYITSICEFNDYIAIACAPLSGIGNSRVFIWDRQTTLATVKESVDWGYGILKVLEEIDGFLVGISIFGGNTVAHRNRIIFRYYIGAGAKSFFELFDSSTSPSTNLVLGKQKIGSRLHFMMSITLNGSIRDGVWSFGKNKNGNWNLNHERTPNNDTAIDANNVKNFFYVGDYLFQSYIASGGSYAVSKTEDGSTYSATSVFESVINPNMRLEDTIRKKQLKSICVTYAPLPSAGQVVLKYRVDSTGSYTTIFTDSTDNATFIEMVRAGSVEFTAGRDYEFRLESYGGAEITGFEYDYELLETNIA